MKMGKWILGVAAGFAALGIAGQDAALAAGQFDGKWKGKMVCEHRKKGKIKRPVKMLISGDAVKFDIKNKKNPKYSQTEGKVVIGDTNKITVEGEYTGKNSDGVWVLWGAHKGPGKKIKLSGTWGAAEGRGGDLICTANLKPIGGGGGGQMASLGPAMKVAPGALDGTWKGDMVCGGKDSYVDSPKKPFEGDSAYSRPSRMKIKGDKVRFMKAATPKGAPKLDISQGDVGADGRLVIEGSFTSKRSGKEFSYSFKGVAQESGIVLWGKMNKLERGCRVAYRRAGS